MSKQNKQPLPSYSSTYPYLVVLLLNEVHLPLYLDTNYSVGQLGEIAFSISAEKQCRVCVVASEYLTYYVYPDQKVEKHYVQPRGGIVVSNHTFSQPLVAETTPRQLDQKRISQAAATGDISQMTPEQLRWWRRRY